MFDKVFGELTYDYYDWNGELELDWYGEVKNRSCHIL